MLVPEAPMDENHLPARAKNEIGLSRQVFSVKPVAVAHAMNKTPDHHFRFRPFRVDAAHVPAPPRLRDFIGHG